MPLHAAPYRSIRPVGFLAAACLLLPAGLAGCYSYNTEVHNASDQSVQISILKGRYQREIGSAVLAPGGSVGWRGATNGPVVAQVTAEGVVHDVSLPRRSLTAIDVWGEEINVTIAGAEQAAADDAVETESENEWETDTGATDPMPEATPETMPETATDPTPDETEMIDLIESDS